MTSPDGPSPFVPPSAPAPGSTTPPLAPQPHGGPAAQPYAQPYAAQPYAAHPYAQATATAPWTTPQPSPRGPGPAVAIIALVVAGLALLIAAGALVVALGSSGAFDTSYALTGTAPQVVEGQPYSGALLATELERVLRDDGSDVGALTCPDTPRIDSDATTTCSGEVDGWQELLTVDFQDGEGHFVLTVEDAP